MATKIPLVQGDRSPSIFFSVKNRSGVVVNLVGATVVLHFRAVGSPTVKETLTCSLIPGLDVDDGFGGIEVNLDAPYDVPGFGGRVQMDWNEFTLDTAGEFEGELEVTFPNGRNQTAPKFSLYSVRPQIA